MPFSNKRRVYKAQQQRSQNLINRDNTLLTQFGDWLHALRTYVFDFQEHRFLPSQ